MTAADKKETEDVVIEIKMRLSGLTYDQAKKMRDTLRDPTDVGMTAIIEEVLTLVNEVAPEAKVEVFAPWAEWRPAVGRRQHPWGKK